MKYLSGLVCLATILCSIHCMEDYQCWESCGQMYYECGKTCDEGYHELYECAADCGKSKARKEINHGINFYCQNQCMDSLKNQKLKQILNCTNECVQYKTDRPIDHYFYCIGFAEESNFLIECGKDKKCSFEGMKLGQLLKACEKVYYQSYQNQLNCINHAFSSIH